MSEKLKLNGYSNISCAKTGDDALQISERKKNEILISNIDLPGISGIELCHRMKESYIKTILITNDEDCAEIILKSKGCAFDYLVKSSDYNNLLQSVRAITLNA